MSSKGNTLTIEQMRRLEELGLDTSDASMIYKKVLIGKIGTAGIEETIVLERVTDGTVVNPGDCYAYTLGDILEKLPKTISHIVGKKTKKNVPIPMVLAIDGYEAVVLGGDYKGHIIRYVSGINGKGQEGYFHLDSLLECAYNELIWVRENGYL